SIQPGRPPDRRAPCRRAFAYGGRGRNRPGSGAWSGRQSAGSAGGPPRAGNAPPKAAGRPRSPERKFAGYGRPVRDGAGMTPCGATHRRPSPGRRVRKQTASAHLNPTADPADRSWSPSRFTPQNPRLIDSGTNPVNVTSALRVPFAWTGRGVDGAPSAMQPVVGIGTGTTAHDTAVRFAKVSFRRSGSPARFRDPVFRDSRI